MSNRKSRLDKLESASAHLSRSAVVIYSGLGTDQNHTASSARFTIDNQGITYDEIQDRGYAFITYIPVKDANR